MIVPVSLFSQTPTRVDKQGNPITPPTNNEKETKLKDYLTKAPLTNKEFYEVSFADFSKLLQTDFTTGKTMSYAAVNIAKPSAEVSYAIRPKGIGKSFFNIGLKGGYDDDVISLIKGQKPSKNYSVNISYSIMLFNKYFYLGSDKYNLKSDYMTNYNKLFVSKADSAEKKKLDADKAKLVKSLNRYYSSLKSTEDQVVINKLKDSIYNDMLVYNSIANRLSKIDSVQKKRDKLADSLTKKFNYNSKHMFWTTISQQSSGNKFHYYDKITPQNTTVNSKQTTNAYESTVTFNYFYKTEKPSVFQNVLNNLLLTGGLSAGYFNNFDELSSTEFKKIEKTDVGTTSYTNTDVTTVYDNTDFKTYHGAKVFLEGYKMFTTSGNLGLRLKYLWDMPYGEPDNSTRRKAQQNVETGIIFNTAKKGSTRDASPISFEVFYSFNDLDGRNVTPANIGQKFYKRNQIGVKTAIPFNF